MEDTPPSSIVEASPSNRSDPAGVGFGLSFGPRLVGLIPRAASLFVTAVGALVLSGWFFDAPALLQAIPGGGVMVPSSALGFLFCGLALGILSREAGIRARVAAAAFALVAALLGLLTLVQRISGRDLRIDHLLVGGLSGLPEAHPTRMAEVTALCFALIGGALLLDSLRRLPRLSDSLAAVPVVLAAPALIGYAYGIRGAQWIGPYQGMATLTSIAFVLLAAGVLLRHPERGVLGPLSSDTAGGMMGRRLLPIALAMPLLLGWLRLLGEREGLYSSEFGLILFAAANALALAATVLWGAAALRRSDEARRRSLTELHASEGRYRSIVEQARAWICTHDLSGKLLSVNSVAAKLLGYDAGELVGTNLRALLAPELAQQFDAYLAEVRWRGEANGLMTILAKDGSRRYLEYRNSLRSEGVGEPVVHGIALDVSERFRTERALRASQEMLQHLMTSSPAVIYSLSVEATQLKLAWMSGTVERLLGYSSDQTLAPGWWAERLHPDDRGRVLAELPVVLAEGHLVQEYRFRDSHDAYRWMRDEQRLVRNSHGDPVEIVGTWSDMTQQKAAEESIRKLHLAIEQAVNVVFMTDAEGRINYVNPSFEATYGYSEEEILGQNPRLLKSGEHDEAFYWEYWQAMLSGAGFRGELINRTKDGRLVTVETAASAVFDGEGNRIGFIAVQNDVTERKHAERRLKESEERYGEIFEASPLPMWLYGVPDLKILAVNQAAVEQYGYSRDEFLKMTLLDLRSPEERVRRLKQLRDNNDPPIRWHPGIWKHLKKDGSVMEVDVHTHRVELGGRKMRLGVMLDVSERVKAERALRESEERYRQIFDASPLPMWLVDENDFRILEANEAIVELHGYSRDELLGMTLFDFRSPEEAARLREELKERPPRWHAGSWRHLKKDGTVLDVDVHTHAVTLEGRKMRLALLRDVTEQRRLTEQLRQAQKMEAVGQLAGGVAHDFNNLLTAILGYADMLGSRIDPRSPESEAIEEIRKAGERAAVLTRQLLAFSRKQVLEPKVLNVNELVKNLEKMLQRLIGENIELETALDPGVANVRADVGQLEQAIVNLAVNSRDAMPDGGKLTLETGNVELDEIYARGHMPMEPGKYVMLAVSDTGIGMDRETQAHLFEPFFTTKERGKGTGLGLAMVYGIVKQSGGSIWVYSEIDKGTIFKIYLPQVGEAAVSLATRLAAPPAEGDPETVLLVEDESAVRKLTRTILERYGYTVMEAAGGEEALEIARRHVGPIHLVLTDVVMPRVGGAELVSRLKAIWPEIRVLYMSGYADEAVVRHGVLNGANVFLQKPFTPDGLARKVREALGMR